MSGAGETAREGALVDWESIVQRPAAVPNEAAVHSAVSGRCVMVTGASGSLGGALSRFLAGFQPRLLVLHDSHESSMFRLRQDLSASHPGTPFRFVLGDIRNQKKLGEVMAAASPDLLFHLAAYKQLPWAEEDPEEFVSVNILGALGVVDEALRVGVGKIVYPSTDKAVMAPSLYGATKKIVEELLRSTSNAVQGLSCGIVRFVNVLGSQGSVSETFARQARCGDPLKVTDQRMDRYWITPAEATIALAHAACLDGKARIVIPDAGEAILVTEIAERIWRRVAPEGVELRIDYIGLREGERLHEELTAPGEFLREADYSGIVLVEKGEERTFGVHEIRGMIESIRDLAATGTAGDLKRTVLDLAHSLM